jgi:hypothetical protein
MDICHPGAIRKGLAVPGDAGRIGVDHRRIPKDRSEHISVMADGDHLPAFVSSEYCRGPLESVSQSKF